MKSILRNLSLLALVMTLSATAFSQTLFLRETFPTATSNANDDAGDDHTISGDLGDWGVVTSAAVRSYVVGTTAVSPSFALNFQTSGSGVQSVTTSSENINLSSVSSGLCAINGLAMKFQLRRASVVTGHTMNVQFSNNGGTTWTTQGPANILSALTNIDQWYTISIAIPNSPTNYWVNDFRVRFTYSRTGDVDATVLVDDVVITDPTVPDFSGAFTQTTDGGAGTFAVGDVYRYNSVVTAPEDYYAEVTIEGISNATIDALDNNAVGVANRFQPRIAPNATLTADGEGYVQFSITFKKTSDNSTAMLGGLRYRHYDIDGSTNAAYTFRETGWITGHSSILVDGSSDLTDAGTVIDAGPPNPTSWRKILGEMAEHDGLSNDADVLFTAVYGAVSTVRFRLGYQFDELTTANYSPGAREYGTEFGCFSLSTQIPLPVKLLSFSGSYRNNTTTLNWETVNELNFERFEIERSSNGADFTAVGNKAAAGSNFSTKQNYLHLDDLTTASGNVFYYRLKMIDTDGKFKYSNVIMIKKDQKAINGIAFSPNPVVNNLATVRFTATAAGAVDLRVLDMSGRVVLKQQNKINDGNNSISVNNLDRLQPGIYVLQVANGEELSVVKFSVTR